MSDTVVGQEVVFTISGLSYEGTIVEEKGDQLIVNVVRQGGRATNLDVMVSKETIAASRILQPHATEDLLVKAGSGSRRGYAG